MIQELQSIPSTQIKKIEGFVAGAKAVLQRIPNPTGNDPMTIETEFRPSGNCHIYLLTGKWQEIDGQVVEVFPTLEKTYDVIRCQCLNNGDGWEVNDAHYTGKKITLPHNFTKDEVIKKMKKDDFLESRQKFVVEDYNEDYSIFIMATNGYYLYELRPSK